MKTHILVLVIVLAVLVADTVSEKRKHKKYRKRVSTPEQANNIEIKSPEEVPQAEIPSEVEDKEALISDPCAKVYCGAGKVCKPDEDDEPQCICIPECPVESEPRRQVCSNMNETWSSDCAVYQQRCWCSTGDEHCRGEEYKHVHIEYYGVCREMRECAKEEMEDFPRRMRDWLFNIMRDMADRKELTPHYLEMEREAESNLTRRWSNAAIWKWCDLDGNPPDRSVSRHELFPIRAPLMALEHCIAPFLNDCDSDNNHKISLEEWGKCLDLNEEDLEDRCDQLIAQ